MLVLEHAVVAGAVGLTNLMHDREQSAGAAYAAGRALALRATAPTSTEEMIDWVVWSPTRFAVCP